MLNSSNSTGLPYNESNCLIGKKDILRLLSIFDTIHNENIYRRAFVHRSYCTRKNENFVDGNVNCPDNCLPLQEESNERLEFLGDAVLHKVVAVYLFDRYPTENEGFLTTMRTKLVNGEMLASLSRKLGFNNYVMISNQIESNNGRQNKNILEDAFEAFIGAIFLDFEEANGSGDERARDWIIHILENYVDFTELLTQNTSYKDRLVKHCQHNYQFIPQFREVDVVDKNNGSNNSHRIYTIFVRDNTGCVIGIGKGNSKKSAELEASKKALQYYNINI